MTSLFRAHDIVHRKVTKPRGLSATRTCREYGSDPPILTVSHSFIQGISIPAKTGIYSKPLIESNGTKKPEIPKGSIWL